MYELNQMKLKLKPGLEAFYAIQSANDQTYSTAPAPAHQQHFK